MNMLHQKVETRKQKKINEIFRFKNVPLEFVPVCRRFGKYWEVKTHY